MVGFGGHGPPRTRRAAVALAALLVLVPSVASCSGDDGGNDGAAGRSTTTAAPTTSAAPPLTVLVTNDDGIGAPGIDALVQALRDLPDTTVQVVAPAANQSGTGGRTTPGGAPAVPATTAGGVAGTAVQGFPADAVAWALGGGVDRPDVVLSGINAGANVGPFVRISVSQGLGDAPPDWSTAVRLTLDWLQRHRDRLVASDPDPTVPGRLENLNVPTCTAGTVRGVLAVPVLVDGTVGPSAVDCAAPPPARTPADDIAAFAAGWAPLSTLAVPAPVPPTSAGGPTG